MPRESSKKTKTNTIKTSEMKEKTNTDTGEQQQDKQPTPTPQPNKNPNGKKRFNFMWIYAILFAVLIGLQFYGKDNEVVQKKDIDQGELIELLKNEEVGKIELVNREDAEIFLNRKGLSSRAPEAKPDSNGISATPNYTYKIGSLDHFEEWVEREQEGLSKPVYIKNVRRNNWMSDIQLLRLTLVI